MKPFTAIGFAIFAACVAPDRATAQEGQCGLALVLSVDVSSSIDAGEYYLQTRGLARAFRTSVLSDALLGLSREPVVATVVQWSGYNHQSQVVPWTRLDTVAAIEGFSRRIIAVPRGARDQPTALAKGLEFAAKLLTPMPCKRLVIDVSGDGVQSRISGTM